MISKYKYKGLLWVDLESPRKEEVDSILEEFNLPSDLSEMMYTNGKSAKTDVSTFYTYSVLHFPEIIDSHGNVKNQEINFIIGKNFLITIHYEVNTVLNKFAKKFEAEELLKDGIVLENSSSLFYYLIQILNEDTQLQLSNLYTGISNRRNTLVSLLCIIIVILGTISIILYLK
jgi:Mg2+ and Co2+ transporter CorA